MSNTVSGRTGRSGSAVKGGALVALVTLSLAVLASPAHADTLDGDKDTSTAGAQSGNFSLTLAPGASQTVTVGVFVKNSGSTHVTYPVAVSISASGTRISNLSATSGSITSATNGVNVSVLVTAPSSGSLTCGVNNNFNDGSVSFTSVAFGITSGASVAIHLKVTGPACDTTNPVISLTTPTTGTPAFELNQVVAASFSCTDAGGSGLASCVGTVANGASINTSTLGAKTFTVNASDGAGNTATLVRNYTVVDTTNPVISVTTPTTGTPSFELNQVVNASFSCSDTGGSGVASCVGTVGNGSPINTSSLGAKTFTVNASDVAGNTQSLVHDYTVVLAPAPPTTQGTTPAATTPPSTVPAPAGPTGQTTTTTTTPPGVTTTTSPVEVAGTQITLPPVAGIPDSSSTWMWWLWLVVAPLVVALIIGWWKIMGGRRRRSSAEY